MNPTFAPVVFGAHEPKVLAQLLRCMEAEPGARGVLCADGHFGYSAPVGGVVAMREHVAPAAVGYDIGCGNMAVRTNVMYDQEFQGALPRIMDEIFKKVSFGVGRNDGKAGDHEVLDLIREAELPEQRAMLDTAAKQLGTVGAGNHYVDLFADEDGVVWIGVHFGSRGFGWKTGNGFMSLAQGGKFEDKAKEGMESPPDLLPLKGVLGMWYIEAMELAGAYAYAGREVVVKQVRDILGADTDIEVHNHHNFAWREKHDGEEFMVVRKGATPARPGQQGFVGATMGEDAVILEGVDSERSAEALYSTVHGAGRAMSRTRAAGKSRKRWRCNTRDCRWVQPPRTHKPEACPECGSTKLRKVWVKETEGEIDWKQALAELKDSGIELRGANAEEAPLAYKRLSDVLAAHEGTVRVLHRLTPIGVAMAPGDVADPYRD